MKNWTTQAEQRLTEYLQERADREGFGGEDALELKEDLRRHIHEEAENIEGDQIGLLHLETILGRLDSGYRPRPEQAGGTPARRSGRFGMFGKFLAWTFGVVLPAGILVFEMMSAFCGGVFFDPVPTWWHAGLIASVPAVNAWLLRGGHGFGKKWQGAAAGFSLVIALFYGLLFLLLIHASILALIFFGLGLLSLTPVLTAFTSWRIGRAARREAAEPGKYKTSWRVGVMAAVLMLLALEGMSLWTRVNLMTAMKEGNPSAAAISRLRTFHSERSLLKACYEGNRGTTMATDISGWILTGWQFPAAIINEDGLRSHDSAKAREVFFRVTGKPFNSMKPPKSSRGGGFMGRMDPFEEVEFDDHLGGDDVAIRLKSLDLADSRFDGHVDSPSRIGYGEWTMVFANGSSIAQEARCQVRLPRGGRVSRLTLWVNDEPREAAFSTVSKVKAAYKEIAVVQRRDPVLVNVVGPDTVMVQCFPVPPHGKMKIRFGVTAPMDGERWELPRIVERNFGMKDNLGHAVWMQGDSEFELTGSGSPLSAHRDGEGHSLSTTLDEVAMTRSGIALVTPSLSAQRTEVWCEDRFAKPEERVLIREPITVTHPGSKHLVVVIDGSASLAGMKSRIIKFLGEIPAGDCDLLLADDHSRRVNLNDLQAYAFAGGRDNEPALREGIRLARETGSPMIWIHGPQAIGLSQSEALLQLLVRGTQRVAIHEVEAADGPNRLAGEIFRSGCLHRGPSLVDSETDFGRFLRDLRTERREIEWNWRRAGSTEGLAGSKVWDQLARSWAAATVDDPAVVMTDTARAELAARYQMVTSFSGAVVLETQAQYDAHGLTPADADATPQVPNVPEPSAFLLIVLSVVAALLRRNRAA